MRPSALVIALLGASVLVTAHDLSHLSFINVRGTRTALEDGASLTASPDVIPNHGQVTVKFENPTPNSNDWVGVYSPSSVVINETTPVKYQMCTFNNPSYTSTGMGVFVFDMVNMRGDYVFVLFKGGLTAPVAIATSNTIGFLQPNEPLRPRLLLTGNAGEMRLMWSAATADKPYARWGIESGKYDHVVFGTSDTYSRSDMCGSPANGVGFRNPGPIMSAILTGLEPGTVYYYVFGDASEVTSSEFTFKTPAGPNMPTRIVAYGDMGMAAMDDSRTHYAELPSLNTTRYVKDAVSTMTYDAVFHIGDISYARGYASEWDQFFDQITPIASRLPYMVCLGNHERDFPNSGSLFTGQDSGGECGVAMEKQLVTPRASFDAPWYSVNVGNIHAVFMSTENDFSEGSPQYNFIKSDLANVDRSKTPWVIFNGHRPMYIDSTYVEKPAGDQPVAELLRKEIEPLLFKNKVDLALWGHNHSYQRNCAAYQAECKQNSVDGTFRGPWVAPVQMVIGMAGQGLSLGLEPELPKYTELVKLEYGYTTIETANATYLELTFFGDSDNSVQDRVTIIRE